MVFFTDSNTGYVSSHPAGVLKTINGGASWFPLGVGAGSVSHLFSIYFTHPDTGFVVGGNFSSPYNGIILKTTDAGASWSAQPFADNFIGNVRFLNSNVGFAAGGSITGNSSTILKTVDGGTNWSVQSSGSARQFGLCIPSSNVAFTSGLYGTILKTTNIIGIDELTASKELGIFPNPASSYLNINTTMVLDKIVVRDIAGKTIKIFLPSSNTIDVSDFPNGVYILTAMGEKGSITRKFIKQ